MKYTFIAIISLGVVLLTGCMISDRALTRTFGKYCAMGLAEGKKVETDCSFNIWKEDGNLYCFKDDPAKRLFSVDIEGNIEKAKRFYSKMIAAN